MKYFVDMDGTLAKWNKVSHFEELLEKGYFISREPNDNIIEAVKSLIEAGREVYILSAYITDSEYALAEKNEWLDKYTPFIPLKKRIYCPIGENKILYASKVLNEPIQEDWILLDDYSLNLHEWDAYGGQGIKCLNGINGNNGTWKKAVIFSCWPPSYIVKEMLKV